MSPVQPRALVHRGSVRAAGFVLDVAAIGLSAAQQRVLARYQPGAELLALDARRWLLRLPQPLRLLAEHAPGTVLTCEDGVLLSAPLSPGELRALDPAPGSVVLVHAGEATCIALAGCERLDPALWLDLGAYARMEAEPLPRPASEVKAPSADADPSLRRLLSVPEAAPEQAAFMASLSASADGEEGSAARARELRLAQGRQLGARLRALGSWLRGAPAALRDALARLRAGRGRAASTPALPPSASSAPAEPRRPTRSWAARFGAWLDARAREWLYWSRLGRVIGRWHARYLWQTLDLFERGDFHNALRQAIPLGGEHGERIERLGPPLRAPRPRADLAISAHRTQAKTTMPIGSELLALLRERYQRAARVLTERGQIEEAAFVYAELLGDALAAVTLLERHGQLRKAAELAEGRKLAAALVIRQWLLCGDIGRALLIARRDGAFAQALVKLEPGHPEHAARLRLAWADVLAEAGDYAGAVDALWPLAQARALVREFLERALLAGGVQRGRSLGRMVELEHDLPRTLARVRELLADPASEAVAARQGFNAALLAARPTRAVRSGARAALRATLDDRARGLAGAGTTIDRLLGLAGDAALRTDLPPLGLAPAPRTTPLMVRTQPLVQAIAAADHGALAVHDAALLPNGRLLCALGAAGVRLYAPDLRTHSHWYEPAEQLVLNPQGTRALALDPRGPLYRIARLELTQRRAESWCDVALDSFAGAFDGSRWFVVRDHDLLALDACADDVRGLLRVPAIAPYVGTDFVLSAGELELVVLDEALIESNGAPQQYYGYSLDPLVLRKRRQATQPKHTGGRMPLGVRLRPGSQGELVWLALVAREGTQVFDGQLLVGEHVVPLGPQASPADSTLKVTKSWAAAATARNGGAQVVLVNLATGACALRVELEGAVRVGLRLDGEQLVIADDRGRVRVLALDDGRILRDLRLSA